MASTEPMLDSTKVGIAKGRPGGYGIVCPAGTDIEPLKDVSKTLKELLETVTGAESLGYISEDGVTFTTDTDSSDIVDWSGTTVSSELSSYAESAQVGFLESRASVLKAVYGAANVTTNEATTEVRHNNAFTSPNVYVFDAVISPTVVKRTIIPAGRIFERDDVTQNNSDPIAYTPTIKCFPSEAIEGDTYRDYLYDSSLEVA